MTSSRASVRLDTPAASLSRWRAARMGTKSTASDSSLLFSGATRNNGMDLQLKGKVALVAGSSRGIGRSIAQALLRERCRVSVTGREGASLKSAGDALMQEFGGDNLHPIARDLTSRPRI